MKPVAVLGTGPAGLMAALGVAMSGKPVSLFGKADSEGNMAKSRIGGAQFLHDPLPIVCNEEEPDGILHYIAMGTPEGYRQKVYGSDPTIPFVSMEHVHSGKAQPAWSLINTYDLLWEHLSAAHGNVVDITAQWLDDVIEKQHFDQIISTIPVPALCWATNGAPLAVAHNFVSQEILIGMESIVDGLENEVYYNGDPNYSWYRCSNIFGVGSTEWSGYTELGIPMSDLVRVRKPIRTTCDCFTKHVMRTGRYGAWTKGILTHQAFTDARKLVNG